MANLTDKQEKFIQNLLNGQSQREAYKNSYNASKMKDNTIDRRASELANNSVIKARFDELKGKLRDKAEEEGLMSATELLRKLNDLIIRNEKSDDRLALEGIKTLGKNLGVFIDKIEHSGEIKMPTITISK